MTPREFDIRQIERQSKSLKAELKAEKERPLTKYEKDWFNLNYMRTMIKFGSILYRNGAIGSLDRAMARLEKVMNDEERRRIHGHNRRHRHKESDQGGKEEEQDERE